MVQSKIVRGVSWSAIERFSVQAIQFITSMILARLLEPEMFGVIALALVILNVLQTVNETGFGAALMQKIDRDELDFSTVFVLNMIMGLGLYGLLFLLAPVFSVIFNNEELTNVIRLIAINLIITSLVVVQRTKLFIAVDFKTMAKASLLAVFISGCIGIYCAYTGWGVMAIVIQSLVNNFVNTLFIWLQVKWRPNMRFSKERFKKMFQYAYKLILSRLINVIFNETYSFVIGFFYKPAQLGLFNRAKSFETLATNNVTMLIQRVSIPIFCEQQKNKEKMGQMLLKFISSAALIVYPLLFGMAVLADPLVRVLLTDKWIGVVWILRILCLVGVFYLISTFNRNVFNATGRTDWALKTEIYKKSIAVIIIAIAIYWGFVALVWSQVFVAFVEVLIDVYYTKKQIGVGVFSQIRNVSNILLASLIMAIIVYCSVLFITNTTLQLLSGIFIGIFVYTLTCYIFNIANIRKFIKLR